MAAPDLERAVEHGLEDLVLARRPPKDAFQMALRGRQHRLEGPRHVARRLEEEPVFRSRNARSRGRGLQPSLAVGLFFWCVGRMSRRGGGSDTGGCVKSSTGRAWVLPRGGGFKLSAAVRVTEPPSFGQGDGSVWERVD